MASYIVTSIIILWILILYFKSINKNTTTNYKNEIVSLGVLGTFIGIAMGLFGFDATHIKESMPLLLEGLKTAFITSGVGIFFSILISISKPVEKTSVTLQDISNNQVKIIETLEKSLEHISKKANTEMVNLLGKIVKDFNDNLTEQFGDNFKQLNLSVKAMIVWQENYKSQIEYSEQNLKNLMINLEKISEIKKEQENNINKVIGNLAKSSDNIVVSLKKSTQIVEESMKLLLREVNGKI